MLVFLVVGPSHRLHLSLVLFDLSQMFLHVLSQLLVQLLLLLALSFHFCLLFGLPLLEGFAHRPLNQVFECRLVLLKLSIQPIFVVLQELGAMSQLLVYPFLFRGLRLTQILQLCLMRFNLENFFFNRADAAFQLLG